MPLTEEKTFVTICIAFNCRSFCNIRSEGEKQGAECVVLPK